MDELNDFSASSFSVQRQSLSMPLFRLCLGLWHRKKQVAEVRSKAVLAVLPLNTESIPVRIREDSCTLKKLFDIQSGEHLYEPKKVLALNHPLICSQKQT